MEIKKADTKEDFESCWPLMQLLYPGLEKEQYLTLVLYMMDESYKLFFIEEENKAASLCGYRYQTTLYHHRSICIDHLCTLPDLRKQGYAAALLRHVLKEAKEAECTTLCFNSYYEHPDMLLFFLKSGFTITAHHLVLNLNSPT